MLVEYYFQNEWWSESGGDSKKCKKLSASDILAKIFENHDLPSPENLYFSIAIAIFKNLRQNITRT